MTTRKAMQSFTLALDRRFLVTHGTRRRQRRDAVLRPIRFPAGVLKALAACKEPMSFNDTQVFRKLFPEQDYPASGPSHWKDDDALRQQDTERHHSRASLMMLCTSRSRTCCPSRTPTPPPSRRGPTRKGAAGRAWRRYTTASRRSKATAAPNSRERRHAD